MGTCLLPQECSSPAPGPAHGHVYPERNSPGRGLSPGARLPVVLQEPVWAPDTFSLPGPVPHSSSLSIVVNYNNWQGMSRWLLLYNLLTLAHFPSTVFKSASGYHKKPVF